MKPRSDKRGLPARAGCPKAAYAPLLRLDRDSAARAMRFSGLGGRGGGRRVVAGWDEDPLTLAVEAGADHRSGARHGGVRILSGLPQLEVAPNAGDRDVRAQGVQPGQRGRLLLSARRPDA